MCDAAAGLVQSSGKQLDHLLALTFSQLHTMWVNNPAMCTLLFDMGVPALQLQPPLQQALRQQVSVLQLVAMSWAPKFMPVRSPEEALLPSICLLDR